MKNIPGKWQGSLLAFLAGVLLLAGCARTAAVSYYQLSPLEAPRNESASGAAGKMVLGIGPVRLPEYLDRAQFVTRLSANRLQLADSHRWAEPLNKNIARVMGKTLAALLGPSHIVFHPWPSSRTADYQFLADVLHFENESDGAARMVVLWSVKDKDGGVVLPERRSSYLVPALSRDPEGQVAALNQALGTFCREIARELTELQAKPSRSKP